MLQLYELSLLLSSVTFISRSIYSAVDYERPMEWFWFRFGHNNAPSKSNRVSKTDIILPIYDFTSLKRNNTKQEQELLGLLAFILCFCRDRTYLFTLYVLYLKLTFRLNSCFYSRSLSLFYFVGLVWRLVCSVEYLYTYYIQLIKFKNIIHGTWNTRILQDS